jgi:hypothetical protein
MHGLLAVGKSQFKFVKPKLLSISPRSTKQINSGQQKSVAMETTTTLQGLNVNLRLLMLLQFR